MVKNSSFLSSRSLAVPVAGSPRRKNLTQTSLRKSLVLSQGGNHCQVRVSGWHSAVIRCFNSVISKAQHSHALVHPGPIVNGGRLRESTKYTNSKIQKASSRPAASCSVQKSDPLLECDSVPVRYTQINQTSRASTSEYQRKRCTQRCAEERDMRRVHLLYIILMSNHGPHGYDP